MSKTAKDKTKVLPALSTAELDQLGHTLISLAKELWVLHDRQRVMEAKLAELGFDLELDTYTPPSQLASLLESERTVFVNNLIDTLTGREPATGDAIVATRADD